MEVNKLTRAAYQLFHNGTLALARAERSGIRIDIDQVEKEKAKLSRIISKLEERFKNSEFYKGWEKSSEKEINIYSNPQLSEYLYKVKKIKIKKQTATGEGSTDREALKSLNIPALNDLLEIRKLKKIRDTYLESFLREQVNGYIHPVFNLHLVKTYRSSSNSPNLQNIPAHDEEATRICRKVLFARPDHLLLEVDFKSVEVIISASYNHDSGLIKYLKNPSSDMHTDLAREIFLIDKLDKNIESHKLLRQATKNGFVFPEFYGDYYLNCAENVAYHWCKLPMSIWKQGQGIQIEIEGESIFLSDYLISKGIKSFNAFIEHLKRIEENFWNNRFPEFAEWKEQWWRIYQKRGYIDLLTGFRCSGVMRKNDVINYPIQGTAFHCLLWVLIEMDIIIKSEKLDSRIVGQIHDSILFDINPDELEHICLTIKKVACEWLPNTWDWIIVPLSIEMEVTGINESWAEKTKIIF